MGLYVVLRRSCLCVDLYALCAFFFSEFFLVLYVRVCMIYIYLILTVCESVVFFLLIV